MGRDFEKLTWRKSTRSNGGSQCVEVACVHDALWRKSTRSGNNGQCVEAAQLPSAIAVRDSKLDTTGDFPVLSMSREDWTALLAEVRTDR